MVNKDSRIKNNLRSSLVYQFVLVSLIFILPRLYLENFGSEVNGVLSTIKQIFIYMFLLEAGVGLATTQALYKRVWSKLLYHVQNLDTVNIILLYLSSTEPLKER